VKKSSSNQYLHVIIVGNAADEFVRYTMGLLDDSGVGFTLCGDVYLAVGQLLKRRSSNVLVVGRLERLNREQGRLFHIAGESGCVCCCLADGDSSRVQKQISAAAETGVLIINEPAQIGEAIAKLPADSCVPLSNKKGNVSSSAFIKDDFVTTKAELDALLGI